MTKIALLAAGVGLAMLVAVPLTGADAKTAPKHSAKHAPKHPPAAPGSSLDPGPARTLGSAGAWSAYVAQNKAGKVCYIVAHPAKSEPAGLKRKPPSAMVTHRTEDKVSNVVSFAEGYPLKPDVDVVVEMGGRKFELFASDDSAWARTADLDKTLVETMIKEGQLVVRGTPQKGRPTADTYLLAGFTKAIGLIDKACDVKR